MKWLFGLLLLLSLAFFAFMQWGGAGGGSGKNLQPQPPLNAEKIKLLSPSSASSVAHSAMQTASACMEWGGFAGGDLSRATAALSALKLGDKLTQRQVEHVSGYWVYIPPLKSRPDVEQKIAQLKALGVEDYFVMQDAGKWRNAISLGVFKTEDAALKFLASISAKGVRSARAGEHASKNMLTVFVLKEPDAGVTARMAALQKDFPDSELKATACAN